MVSPHILPTCLGGYLEEEEAVDYGLVPAMMELEDYYKGIMISKHPFCIIITLPVPDLANYGFVKSC